MFNQQLKNIELHFSLMHILMQVTPTTLLNDLPKIFGCKAM